VHKKIGILTYHRSVNYGAVLQAYALCHALRRLGCAPEVIDYMPAVRRGVYSLKPFWSRETWRRAVQRDDWSGYVSANFLYRGGKRLRNRRFESFIRDHIPLTAVEYRDYEALTRAAFDHDAFVCGSDQIWNVDDGTRFDPGYFLDFAGAGRRRVAYAPSFGGRGIPDDRRPVLRELLSRFDALSVREKSGADIVRALTGREAEPVLDPTLLLDCAEWRERAAGDLRPSRPYVVCYAPAFSPGLIDYALGLRKRRGFEIVAIDCYGPTKSWLWKTIGTGIRTIYSAGPAEFLHLYGGADMVLTTTFHGTAFALNFQKPFYTWLRPGTRVNARIEELLEEFDLSSRIVLGGAAPAGEPMDIDFGPFRSGVAERRVRSLDYLRRALGLDKGESP
jgi:hypothetical protein